LDFLADKFNHGVDVDPASHVPDEVNKRSHTNKRQYDGDGERQMWDERTLVPGATVRSTINAQENVPRNAPSVS